MNAVVIIPTYNEASGIEKVLDAVLLAEPRAHVLVVDDSSPDGTAALVAAHPACPGRVTLLNRAAKDGLGAAYRAGFAWALDRDYDVIVQMDADLSHPLPRSPNWWSRWSAQTLPSAPATSSAGASSTGVLVDV